MIENGKGGGEKRLKLKLVHNFPLNFTVIPHNGHSRIQTLWFRSCPLLTGFTIYCYPCHFRYLLIKLITSFQVIDLKKKKSFIVWN